MFTGQTDPIPYITAAYGLGILILAAYGAIQLRLRRKLRALEGAIQGTGVK